MSQITIADIQAKLLEMVDRKFKGGASKQRLTIMFTDVDKDHDGFISLPEFELALENASASLKSDEAGFLFMFWDTAGGQQEAQGAVPIGLAVQDLLSSKPTYSGAFNSGNDGISANRSNRSNKSSIAGGIFGGGSYAADANGELPPASHRAPAFAPSAPAPGAQVNRPRGNQSSIQGGIFGEVDINAPAPPSNRGGVNKSNQSSIQGGIFGEAPTNHNQANNQRSNRSNQSSIPGGIFG